MSITNTEALARIIDHREIFHDEMLTLMRRIMSGEMSPVMIAAFAMGLRVKKETIGEIAAAAQVMREFATPVNVADKTNMVDLCGTGGDGARLFNAAAALGVPAKDIAQHFDSVSVCFSKGLGAPVGSALCGSKALIKSGHRWRKMLGGGMRQAGVLAAGALHALDHHVTRLADDHALARRLAEGLQGIPGVRVEPPQTNMVFIDVEGKRAQTLLPFLKSRGVLATGLYRLRFVTHLDVDAAGVDRAIAAVREHLTA